MRVVFEHNMMARSMQILLLTLTTTLLCNCLKRQDLGGQWTVVGQDVEITLNATVPGGIFSDLMDSGVIEDIFYGTGDSDYSWVGLIGWFYSSSFRVDEELLAHDTVNLVFEGLDTFATVSINGVEVGKSENMFVRYTFNIKEQLQVGSNDIWIEFSSPVKEAITLSDPTNNEYVVPPECPASESHGICHVNRIRKMQASFSWDWGPAFASVGIWKDVYLEAFDSAVIKYVLATTIRNPSSDLWTILFTTYFEGGEKGRVQGTLTAKLEGEQLIAFTTADVDQALNEYSEILLTTSMEVTTTDVETWWPNGYGTQTLYNLTVTFTSGDEQDEKTVKVGFRTVELVQEELEQGLSFYFKVNDHPIFAKGANEIPINILPKKGQDHETIRKVLQTAKDVNMNMLRVWGGGIYESDYFYDLADEFGILIWQDFMFACAMYPTDGAFLSNVVEEVRHQIKRLHSHPSIALWSGSNENEAALVQNWYGTADNFTLYKDDYVKLYVDVIKPEVIRLIRDATYITSSPTNGLESEEEGYVAQNPADPLYGDVHFYDYSSDSWSVNTFPIPRFASEYGYQSMPSIDSWLTATDNVDDINPYSLFLNNRQHHSDGNTQNVDLIELQLQLPDRQSQNYEKAFIYFSQIVQAQSIKVETEHYLSFKGRVNELQQGYTMGALYWQLNDVWVAPTWSGMDYTGKWKMLQYFSKNFFAPYLVTGKITPDNQLEIYVVTDQLTIASNATFTVLLHIYKWDSFVPLVSLDFPATLDPLKAVLAVSLDARTALYVAGCGGVYEQAISECFFHLHLLDEGGNDLAPYNYLFPQKLKNSNITDANLQISSVTPLDDDGKIFEIHLSSDVNTLFVWLDSHEITGRFSQNGFLQVLPTWNVTFISDEPTTEEVLLKVLTVTHLRDPAYL